MSYEAEIRSEEGVVSYWPMSDAVGSSLIYDQVSKNHLSVAGNVRLGVPGLQENDSTAAYLSNPSQAQVFSSDFNFSGRAPFSVEVWLAADVFDQFFRVIASKYDGTSGWVIGAREGAGVMFQRLTSAGVEHVTSNLIVAGAQHHFVFAYDGTKLSVYQDADLVRSSPSSRLIIANTSPLIIGGWPTAAFQTGVYQHVAVYDVALSERKIYSHFSNGRDVFPDSQRIKQRDRLMVPVFP